MTIGSTSCNTQDGFTFSCSTYVTVSANTGYSRTGYLYVSYGAAGTYYSAPVLQLGPPETLTVSVNGGGRVTSSPSGVSCPGTCSVQFSYGTVVTLTAAASSGYVFTGWSGACSGTGSCMVSMYGPVNVTATFTALETLTVNVTGGGTVTSSDGYINCPGTCSHTYLYNQGVTLYANPAQGWTFSSWGGACGGNGTCNLVMTNNLSASASFAQIYHMLTVSVSGSGTVTSADGYINCPGTCSHTYAWGTPVTLNAMPASGWSFSGWSGACSGTGQCNLTMTQDQSVSATFTQNSYTLTVSTFGSGTVTSSDGYINCPGTCTHTYLSLTDVTLTATPAQGWSFSGWTGQCKGVGSCTLEILGNYSVTAVFVEPGHGYQFTPVTPCRLVDTRTGGNPIQGGTYESFDISQLGSCGIPTTATGYSLNVTIIPSGQSLGYVTVWPTGQALPNTSTMNSPDGRVKADAVIVAAGSSNSVSIYSSDTTNILLDINGYFAAPNSQTYQFYPLAPCRVVDTRTANGPLGGPRLVANTERDFPLLSNSCIPSGVNIEAYSLNFTVIPNPAGQQLGYLTVWATGTSQPATSTLNNYTATVVANAAIVAPGTSGKVAVYPNDTTDLLIDINGYFAAAGTGGLSLYPAAQCRVLDTRQNQGQPWQGERTVSVTGSVCAEPSSAQVYIFNATVLPSGSMPYLALWADGQAQPITSTLNAYDGFATNNLAIVSTTDGSIDAYAAGLTQLLLDITGYFAP